jgi:hypothetical protein
MLAASSRRHVILMQDPRNKFSQVILDLTLVLRSGRHDLRLGNQPVVANTVTMKYQSTGSFGGMAAFA